LDESVGEAPAHRGDRVGNVAFGPQRLTAAPPPVSWLPDGLPFPRQPQGLNEARDVIVMRAEAGQPDHFARTKANSRDARRHESASR